jgi:hypothetical protein
MHIQARTHLSHAIGKQTLLENVLANDKHQRYCLPLKQLTCPECMCRWCCHSSMCTRCDCCTMMRPAPMTAHSPHSHVRTVEWWNTVPRCCNPARRQILLPDTPSCSICTWQALFELGSPHPLLYIFIHQLPG